MGNTARGAHARRAAALLAAGALASAMWAPAALAADETTNANGQTELFVKYVDNDEYAAEVGNISFSVPAKVDFGAKKDGTLVAPEGALVIENASTVPVRASSMKVSMEEGWSLVADAAAADPETDKNAVSLEITPRNQADAKVRAVDYTTKGFLATSDVAATLAKQRAAWSMLAHEAEAVQDYGGTGVEVSDEVSLKMTGKVGNLEKNIADSTQFGTIQWYVTPGTPEADPSYDVHEADGSTTHVTQTLG